MLEGDEIPLKSEYDENERCDVKCCSCSKAVWYVIILSLLSMTLFADQNLLGPVITDVAIEFGFVLTDVNGTVILDPEEDFLRPKVDEGRRDKKLVGDITLAFFLLGGFVSLIVGYFADTVNRRNTLAVVVVLGETACLSTYFTTGYNGLFLTRALTGIAIGGAIPLMFSLFGDLFTAEYRGKATAAAGVAMGAGGGLGQVLAGFTAGPNGADWRNAFVIVAVPAYFLVVIMLLTVKEPPRGTKEEALLDSDGNPVMAYSEKLTWKKVRLLFTTPTVVAVFIQGIPASLPWGVIIGFLNDFLIVEKDVDREASGFVILSFGLGAVMGAIFGGWAADKLFEREQQRYLGLLMGSTTAVGAIPMWILVNLPPQSVFIYMLISLPSGMIIGITGSTIKVVLVNVTLPEVRGSAFSIFNLFDDIGKGAGTFIVAILINVSGSRTAGINYALGGWVLGAFVHFYMYTTIERDYKISQEHLKALLGGGGDKQLSA